jgi:hypothetical protein
MSTNPIIRKARKKYTLAPGGTRKKIKPQFKAKKTIFFALTLLKKWNTSSPKTTKLANLNDKNSMGKLYLI